MSDATQTVGPARSSSPEGAATYAPAPLCPRCHYPLVRISSQFLDQLLSIISPVRRYRCSQRNKDLQCTWEGIVSLDSITDPKPYRNQSSTPPTTARPRIIQDSLGAFGDVSFEDMAQITLDAIGDAVLVVDPESKVIYLNKVAESLTGWPSKIALGRSAEEVFHIVDGTTRRREISPSQRAIREERIVELALGSVLIRRDGSDLAIEDSAAPIRSREGNIAGAVIVFHDARQSRSVTQRMSHLAQHDSLTSLPNRVLLMERLTQALGMANRHGKQLALLFMDLDDFKHINDSYGHAVGDQLLREVAEDIRACVRTTDTVSRLGGDEFVILLTEIEALRDSVQVAEKLLARFALPRKLDGHDIRVSLSIGISVYPENGLEAGALIRNADAAMYQAKKYGRNRYQVYENTQELVCTEAGYTGAAAPATATVTFSGGS